MKRIACLLAAMVLAAFAATATAARRRRRNQCMGRDAWRQALRPAAWW